MLDFENDPNLKAMLERQIAKYSKTVTLETLVRVIIQLQVEIEQLKEQHEKYKGVHGCNK